MGSIRRGRWGSFWQLSETGVAYIFNRRRGFGLSLDVINLACWVRCAADIGSMWVGFGRPLSFYVKRGIIVTGESRGCHRNPITAGLSFV